MTFFFNLLYTLINKCYNYCGDVMKDKILLILKGFVLGIANIIPGVSGGTLAITLGIYERLIGTISHFFKNVKEHIKFIMFLGIGILLSLGLFSNVIGYCLDNYAFATILFFIGIILGGVPLLFRKVKGTMNVSNFIIFLVAFSIIMLMTFMSVGEKNVSLDTLSIGKVLLLFIIGVVASSSMLLPGISGSFVLMLLGYYYPIVNAIRGLTKFQDLFHNVIILSIAGVGILVGIVIAAKLIEWLLDKHEVSTYYGIIGFVIASIISILITAISNTVGIYEIIVGIVLLLFGMFLSNFIGER